MDSTGLVLEGGGMRSAYTAGVLEFFLDSNIRFPYVIGVSAGASNACSYLSGQKGRNRKVGIDHVRDPRFLSFRNLFKEGSLFGMDFIYKEVPTKIEPLDVTSISTCPERFVIVTTDCQTGEPYYIDHSDDIELLDAVRASSSLPFIAPMVQFKGKELLDGGIADPIPLRKAFNDGFEQNLVVLTQPKGYRKKPYKLKKLAEKLYPQHEKLIQSIFSRHLRYNQAMEEVEKLEEEGRIKVLRPSREACITFIEKDETKLSSLYEAGYKDAKSSYEEIMPWLERKAAAIAK
ncbi:patatin family protein [Thalassorhabdus alkalitolerans]|uniref:Patatin family protein n=1 Tax=Thalassorhabdus alkalitolerans TaxID=2282697 RepID=A0ABW0YTH7_9BACI